MEESKIFLMDQNEELESVIVDNYFSSEGDGRGDGKLYNTPLMLNIDSSLRTYDILVESGNKEVKVSSDIIDGCMTFNININDNGGMDLSPKSIYCIKTDDNKYSFY